MIKLLCHNRMVLCCINLLRFDVILSIFRPGYKSKYIICTSIILIWSALQILYKLREIAEYQSLDRNPSSSKFLFMNKDDQFNLKKEDSSHVDSVFTNKFIE